MLDSACERDRVGSGGVVCDCDRDWAAMLHAGQRQSAGMHAGQRYAAESDGCEGD